MKLHASSVACKVHGSGALIAVTSHVINPRRACTVRVTVVGLCVCLSVCLLPH